MVHRREVDGQEIVLGNQGDLYLNAMTWWDHDTGSVWSQPSGRALLGPRAGAELELLPSTLTDWGTWRREHPDTLALDADGGRSGFDLERMAIVVDLGDEAVAFPVPEVRAEGVVNAVVAGVPVAVVVPPDDPTSWSVFSRILDDRVVELVVQDGDLVDPASGVRWDRVRGQPRDDGDQTLDLLPGFTSFVRDFRNHFPAGRVHGT